MNKKTEKLTFLSKTKSGSEWWITLPYSCANNAVSASFLHVLWSSYCILSEDV